MGTVEFDIVYWEKEVGDRLSREHIKIDEYVYRIMGIGEWRALISDEEVRVEECHPRVIRIRKVEFPPNSICVMLGRMRHALGAVVEVLHSGKPAFVEKVGYADQVLFLPICDGSIKKGELLGVVNVIYIKPVKKSKVKGVLEKLEEILSMDVDALINSKDWPYLFR